MVILISQKEKEKSIGEMPIFSSKIFYLYSNGNEFIKSFRFFAYLFNRRANIALSSLRIGSSRTRQLLTADSSAELIRQERRSRYGNSYYYLNAFIAVTNSGKRK